MRRVILATAVLLGLTVTPVAATADPLVMPHVVVAHHTGWAEHVIKKAGGTIVASYPQIGVVVAYTAKDDFAAKVRRTPGIDAVGATRTAKIPKEFFAPRKDVRYTGPNSPNSGQVPPEGTAWDVPALRLPEAHQVTEGSKRTVVGVLDVGVDDTHPDLEPAFDSKDSVSCLAGWADRSPGAWRPTLDGHGTHVAGTIAAARNGTGVVGVAPGTRIAAVKLAELDDTETAESMVCGFVWAAEHGFAVTNNSYRSIPWRYNCDDQPDQAAAKLAVGRAVAYAQRRNVLVVASAGNAGIDLDTRSVDTESPADSTPVERRIDPTCTRLPHELPGVVGTGALDEKLLKASFSNYSASRISVAAPGARVWSTWPNGEYRSASGTSMAAPHASGVAALIASEHPRWSAERVKRALYATASPLPCPDAVCRETKTGTTYYGHGMVDAASAVGAG